MHKLLSSQVSKLMCHLCYYHHRWRAGHRLCHEGAGGHAWLPNHELWRGEPDDAGRHVRGSFTHLQGLLGLPCTIAQAAALAATLACLAP